MSAAAPAQPAPTAQAAPAAPALDNSDDVSPYRWWILLGLWLAGVMEVLDTTIINVALPQMAGNLSATTEEIARVSTSYALANVVVLPMTAFLAGRFGRRRYLTASILIFIAASFLCGISHTLNELVLWRIVQGAGGAALLSTAQATLREIFPRKEQQMVQGIFLIGIVVAPTLGPTLGGWITDNFAWPWVFFVNLPVGILALLPVTTFLEDSKHAVKNIRADWWGIALLTVGLGSLQYVLEEGNRKDWFQSSEITTLAVISAISLYLFFYWQTSPQNPSPVVDLRVLKNRDLSVALALFLALGFGLFGGVFIYPLFAQTVLGLTPTETGLSLLPGGLATVVAILMSVRLSSLKKPVDPRILVGAGLGIFCYSMWMLGHLTSQTGQNDLQNALILRGLGLGFMFTQINALALGNVPPKDLQQASGLTNLTRQLGGSFGIATLTTYLTVQTKYHQAILSEKITASNPYFMERQQGIITQLLSHGYSQSQAIAAAPQVVGQSILKQVLVMTYNDCFLLILLSFVFTAPVLFLMRKPKNAAAGGDAH